MVFGERPLALPSEQRQVVGQEPRLERRSEGLPGYLVGSLLHLHRPPGTYYGYPAYGYPGYGYPGYGYPAYRSPAYGYPAYPQPGYGYPSHSGAPGYLGPPTYGYQSGLAPPSSRLRIPQPLGISR